MHILCITVIAVASTATALTFDCRFIEVMWQGIGQNYQCQACPFNVVSTQYLTNVTDDHMANKTNDDVVAVHSSGCTDLHYIPKGLLNIFPNLIGMYLHGCGVTALNGTELNEYTGLKLFAVELSPIDYLPGHLFAQNPELFFVSFNDNKINSIERDLLRNLRKLSNIYFDNNTCIDANTTTMNVTEFKEKWGQQCSLASEVLHSVTVLLSVLGITFGSIIVCKFEYETPSQSGLDSWYRTMYEHNKLLLSSNGKNQLVLEIT